MFLHYNIKTTRKRWKLQQDEFAEIMKVNRGKVSSYEGGTSPKIEFLILLEELTGIPFRQFVTTMLKPEELPAAPLSEKEFLEVSAGWGRQSEVEMRMISVKDLKEMRAEIDEVAAWMRAEQQAKDKSK